MGTKSEERWSLRTWITRCFGPPNWSLRKAFWIKISRLTWNWKTARWQHRCARHKNFSINCQRMSATFSSSGNSKLCTCSNLRAFHLFHTVLSVKTNNWNSLSHSCPDDACFRWNASRYANVTDGIPRRLSNLESVHIECLCKTMQMETSGQVKDMAYVLVKQFSQTPAAGIFCTITGNVPFRRRTQAGKKLPDTCDCAFLGFSTTWVNFQKGYQRIGKPCMLLR